ncbi:hypothetical protein ACOMHN_012617 [Nucella lapillus]
MAQYSKLVDIMTKRPEDRSDFEIGAILPYFLKRTKAFQRIQRADLLKDLIKNCEFGVRERDDIIIKQGDVGECFYVLLSGQVSVYIHNQDKGEEEEEQELQSIVQYKDGKLDRSRLGLYVISIGEGNSVGEVALIDELKPIRTATGVNREGNSVGEVALIEELKPIRTATVVVDTKTDLLIVDKPLYNRSVKSILAQEFQDKRQFISNNSLFRHVDHLGCFVWCGVVWCSVVWCGVRTWPPKYCKQLTMAMYKRTLPYDGLLVKQGEEVDCVYFILRGQVEIKIDPSAHATQYAKIFKAATENEAEKLIKKADKGRATTDATATTVTNNNPRKRDIVKSTRLCYLGINEAVGDTEMTMDLDTYMQTAMCKEHTEVLVLERKHYERLFVRRHPRTIDAMRQQIGIKLRTRQAHLSPRDDVPFLGYISRLIDLKCHPPQQTPERDRVDFISVSEAEREFLNHKGPLIDQYGPGSVFYLIKVREQTKLKLRSKRTQLVDRPANMKTLPSSLILAAQNLMNGGGPGSHDPADQDQRAQSARYRERPQPVQPKSFRRIQSAMQDEDEDVEETEAREAEQKALRDAMNNNHHDDDDDYDRYGLDSGSGGWRSPRLHGSSDVIEDPEQHDARLSFLEEKIRDWLRKDNPRGGPQVTQLRRLTIHDMDHQPRPGNKVVIRRRRRVSTNSLMDGTRTPRPKKEDSRTKPFKVLLTNS